MYANTCSLEIIKLKKMKGLGPILVPAIILALLELKIVLEILKTEKKGFQSGLDAAQELNNRVLFDAFNDLLLSNKYKYWLMYLGLLSPIIILIVLIAAS